VSSQQQSTRDVDGRETTGRLENEPRLQDPRPREKTRNRSSLLLLSAGALLGAAVFALAVWIIGMILGASYSLLVYLVAAVVGGGVGMGLLPFLSLARQDGTDAEIVRNRRPGRADAPIEGAEAIDEGRAVRSGDHR
jgi:hypothetical protein